MKVYKFGGASVKDADGIKNLAQILKNEQSDKLMVVVSAMGKTTNALEVILKKQCEGVAWSDNFQKLKADHFDICKNLLPENNHIYSVLKNLFLELEQQIIEANIKEYDFYYDQIVSFGEILSTRIISEYLNHVGIECKFTDARQLIITDSNFRSSRVDFEKSSKAIYKEVDKPDNIWITQGFIGSNEQGQTTTLGREGSDYTAAILASVLEVDDLTIWKDVDGVYNADPKLFSNVELIEKLSYKDAVELAFYGASIIHPKTIRPLQEKGIILNVRSFYNLQNVGSQVSNIQQLDKPKTSIIVKKNQVLLSLTPRDFSFMDANHMGEIFQLLSKHQHQINLIQNSAISFSLCVDENYAHFENLIKDLMNIYELKYNMNQVLVSFRHYQSDLMEKIDRQIEIKMEQRNRSTFQIMLSLDEFENKLRDLV